MSAEQEQLDVLLDEEVAGARAREQTAFTQQTRAGSGIILFGAGNLGRKTLHGLRRVGIEPLAFADNNAQRWGSFVEGVPILSPADASALHGTQAAFVTTIWGAGQKQTQAELHKQLWSLGCASVISFGHLYWQYPEVFLPYFGIDLPHKVLEDASAVRAAFHCLADADSQVEFLEQLRWRLTLDFSRLEHGSEDEQYFPQDLLRPADLAYFVDCGAFDGDTLKTYLDRRGEGFEKFIAFEPDSVNAGRLRQYVESLADAVHARIVVRPEAVGARRGMACFEATGTAASVVGTGTSQVEVVPLDEVLTQERPTYLKMDIEGAELDALVGAQQTIQRQRPFLAVCAYHRQDHLWRVPLLIQALTAGYDLYLRPHNREGFDLVCYAVPRR